MKRALIYIPFIIVSFVLEARVSIFSIRPDVTVILAYYFGLKGGPAKGMLLGAFLGTVADGLSGGMLGPNLLSKGMAGYFSAVLFTGFFRWTPLVGLMSMAAVTAIDRAVSALSYYIFAGMPYWGLHALYIIAGQAVLNSVAGLFIKPHED